MQGYIKFERVPLLLVVNYNTLDRSEGGKRERARAIKINRARRKSRERLDSELARASGWRTSEYNLPAAHDAG